MGKASRRKREPRAAQPGSLHERIQSEAQQAREAPKFDLRDADESPALAELLEAARVAVADRLPTQFEIDGRTYWLRCSIGLAMFEVFDSPAKAKPLISAFGGSTESFGHTPGH